MKKIITTLLILCGIYSVASAQTRNTAEFGFDAGFNSSTVFYSNAQQHASYLGGENLGASLEYYFSDAWSLKAKVIYDQKGWGNGFITETNGSEVDGVDFHLNYITIPVMANWHFGRGRNWYLNFGLYEGFLLNASESSNSVDLNNTFSSTDFGVAYGIGVKLPLNNTVKLFFEYDGQVGATNIFKVSDGDTYQTARESFNVGLNFAIK